MKPRVTILSLWRNDATRSLPPRMVHLLRKRSEVMDVDWLWAVGDSSDATEAMLRRTTYRQDIRIVRADTGIVGDDLETRRRRLGATATLAFAAIPERPLTGLEAIRQSHWVLLHESDLMTPDNVADQLLAVRNAVTGVSRMQVAVAGWPMLDAPEGRLFYDIWAYRHLDGRHFAADEPKPGAPIEVASFGSVWLAPAALVRGRTIGAGCITDLCAQWRAEGVRLWTAPGVPVEQPANLWTRS